MYRIGKHSRPPVYSSSVVVRPTVHTPLNDIFSEMTRPILSILLIFICSFQGSKNEGSLVCLKLLKFFLSRTNEPMVLKLYI